MLLPLSNYWGVRCFGRIFKVCILLCLKEIFLKRIKLNGLGTLSKKRISHPCINDLREMSTNLLAILQVLLQVLLSNTIFGWNGHFYLHRTKKGQQGKKLEFFLLGTLRTVFQVRNIICRWTQSGNVFPEPGHVLPSLKEDRGRNPALPFLLC